jgi:trehalose 6-phosphate synthase/phosphatase
LLHEITSKCPGSFIEEKLFSLTWHYRNAEGETGNICSKELISNLEKHIHAHNFKILNGNKAVEIISKKISKGKAVKQIIEQNHHDYILAIGDDVTDEDMFEVLLHNNHADTIKVGNGITAAKNKLDNVNEVVSLLEQLSQCD